MGQKNMEGHHATDNGRQYLMKRDSKEAYARAFTVPPDDWDLKAGLRWLLAIYDSILMSGGRRPESLWRQHQRRKYRKCIDELFYGTERLAESARHATRKDMSRTRRRQHVFDA
jgi:hypothetical protein